MSLPLSTYAHKWRGKTRMGTPVAMMTFSHLCIDPSPGSPHPLLRSCSSVALTTVGFLIGDFCHVLCASLRSMNCLRLGTQGCAALVSLWISRLPRVTLASCWTLNRDRSATIARAAHGLVNCCESFAASTALPHWGGLHACGSRLSLLLLSPLRRGYGSPSPSLRTLMPQVRRFPPVSPLNSVCYRHVVPTLRLSEEEEHITNPIIIIIMIYIYIYIDSRS